MATDYTSLEEGQRKATTFESSQTTILNHMLQRTYDYAERRVDAIHVYFQISEGRAAAEFLFEVDGKVLEVDTLEQAELDPPLAPDLDRRQWLMNGMAQELLAFINHSLTHNRPLPTEVWNSVDLKKDKSHTSFAYNFNRKVIESKEAILKWKGELEDPSYEIVRELSVVNLSDSRPGTSLIMYG